MRYFLFDFDGTLINSAPGLMQSIKDVAEKNGLPKKTDAEILPHLGLSEFHAFRDLYHVRGREEALLNDQMRQRYDVLADEMQRPFDGIPAWLQMLKDEGATLIVCSVRHPYNSAPLLEKWGCCPILTTYGATTKAPGAIPRQRCCGMNWQRHA